MAVPSRLFPMRAGKPRALQNIKMKEISGVDHPATMMEGWMVQKAKDDPEFAKFTEAVQSEEMMVKAHEVLGQLLLSMGEGSYLADAPDDVRKSAETLFEWLRTEGFVGEEDEAAFTPSADEPSQRRFIKLFSRLASVAKQIIPGTNDDAADADEDAALIAALEEAMPRFMKGVDILKSDVEATPAQKRAGIAYLIADLGATIQKHGKFKHDNKDHAKGVSKEVATATE